MRHMLVKTTERRLETVFGRFLRVLYHSIDRLYLIYSDNVCVALLNMSALLTRWVRSFSMLMIVLGRG